jgi:hypothetical protein
VRHWACVRGPLLVGEVTGDLHSPVSREVEMTSPVIARSKLLKASNKFEVCFGRILLLLIDSPIA